jgi:hypothetical protein
MTAKKYLSIALIVVGVVALAFVPTVVESDSTMSPYSPDGTMVRTFLGWTSSTRPTRPSLGGLLIC